MSDSPVGFTVAYPERLSRGTLLLKTFFGWLYVGFPTASLCCSTGSPEPW